MSTILVHYGHRYNRVWLLIPKDRMMRDLRLVAREHNLTPRDHLEFFKAWKAVEPLPPTKPPFFPLTDIGDKEDDNRTYRRAKS